MANNLETMIQKLISEAAASMASQIAVAVRKSLAAEIMGTLPAAPVHSQPAAHAVKAPAAAAKAPAAAAKSPLAPLPPGRKRRSFVRRVITPGELAGVLDVIRRNPGFTSTQIQKELGIDGKEAGRLLGKLRIIKKVAWKGERAKATYTVA